MKKRFTKIISAILTAACVAAPIQASAELLGLGRAGRTTVRLEGSLERTPAENKFGFAGKEFIVLDSEEKNDKTYFFILTEEHYGRHNFNDKENIAYWDVDSPTNIAYWLNNDFLTDGNGGNYKLPDEIITYIDYEHEWNTEPITQLADNPELSKFSTELISRHGVALLSNYEWKKYINKFGSLTGGDDTAMWLFRTCRADVGVEGGSLYTGGSFIGTTGAWGAKANTHLFVRPCFWLSEDFFKNNKITSAGANIVVDIDKFSNPSLYSESEKKNIFSATASDVYITGDPIVGEDLTVNYTYTSVFDENGTAFEWYASDSADGDYTKINGANGKTFTLTTAQQGKYIKANVIPGSKSRVNPIGNAAMSNTAVGFVYGEAEINAAVNAVNSASADNVFAQLSTANLVFKLDLTLSELSPAAKDNVAVIFVKTNSDSVEAIRNNYKAAVALQKLNDEPDPNIVDTMLVDDDLMLDTERYIKLSNNTSVLNEVCGKNFNDYDEFKKAFTQATALADFKETDRSDIKNVMLAQDKYLTADISALSDYRLGLASTSVLNAKYNTFEELDGAVTAAVNAAKEVEDINNALDASDVNKTGYPSGFDGTTAPSIAYRQNNVPSIESDEEEETTVFADLSLVPWAQNSITELYKRGIVSGDGDGMFRPNDTLKREEFVTMIANTFFKDYKAENGTAFTDVDASAWYTPYVNTVFEKGVASGMSDEIFGIGSEITREDMAVILYRLIPNKSNSGSKTFTDSDQIADYAKEAVEFMAANGIINGMDDGSFNPKGAATRAMAAKVIYGVLEFIEG